MRQLVRAALHRKILLCVGCMTLYTGVVAAALWIVRYWHVGLLKETVFWLCFAGFPMIYTFVTPNEDKDIFRTIFFDNVKAVILIEFLVNTYTFPLLGELLFVPVVTFFVIVDAVVRLDEKNAQVSRLTGGLLAIIGFTVIGFAIHKALGDYRNLGTLDTVRNLLFVPILSIAFSPFIYVLLLLTTYKLVFRQITIGPEKGPDLKSYARRRIWLSYGLRLKQLRAFSRDHAFDLRRMRTTTDVDNLLGVQAKQ